MSKRIVPARRIYYDWEKTQTKPDLRLGAAFEQTDPVIELPSLAFEEEVTTAEWLLPALGLLIGGILLGHWWANRKKETKAVVAGMVDDDWCGLDALGAD